MASPPHERFSLLLLEDNEVLLDDVAVDYEFIPATSATPAAPLPPAATRLSARRGRARGRLKLASRSLAFDPDDLREPVVRVPLDATRPARIRTADPPDEPPAPPLGAAVADESGGVVAAPEQATVVTQDVPWIARFLSGVGLGFLTAGPGFASGDGGNRSGSGDCFEKSAGDGAGVVEDTAKRREEREGAGGARRGDDAGDVVVVAPYVEAGQRVRVRKLKPWSRGENLAGTRWSLEGVASSTSSGEHAGDGDSERHLAIRASRALFQREGGADHAYVDAELRGTHCFYPLYSGADTLLELVSWLQRIAALPARRERERALREAVRGREEKVPFDIAWLEGGVNEKTIFDRPCAAVSALSRAPGRARITTTSIYLMPIHGGTGGLMTRVPLSRLMSVRRMRHGLRDSALEIGYESSDAASSSGNVARAECRMTMMLAFKSRKVREEAIRLLSDGAPRKLQRFDQAELDRARSEWRSGEMSNFDYLLFLNLTAGRSFNDLSQYPVFPWILADYESSELDLDLPSTFRDLSLPIGALEPSRRAFFEERYREMPPPRFHYGTHYSTPAYVINFLVRVVPGAMLRLQNGRFDAADRLFNSVADAWGSVANSTTDVKELIPEFFAVTVSETPAGIVSATTQPTEFLENVQCLELGMRQDGKRVDDVELPPWANGSADVFLAKHRLALESMHVSRHIHLWIDLIFGVKARNPDACNVFYTDVSVGDIAQGSLDEEEGEECVDPDTLLQLETVLLEFGRTPDKLFQHLHPPRFGSLVTDAVGLADEILLSPGPLLREAFAKGASELRSSSDDSHDDEFSSDSDACAESDSVRLTLDLGVPVSQVDDSASMAADYHGNGASMSDACLSVPTENRSASLMSSSSQFSGVGDRTVSTTSVSERHLYITLAPSCSFLSRFTNGASRRVAETSMRQQRVGANEDIVDFAVAYGSMGDRKHVKPTVVTAWSDGHLRVFVDSSLHRSRHVIGLTSVACGDAGRMFLGTAEGSLLLYSISSGRSEVLLPNAHSAVISTICYIGDAHILVTGSEDATVSVWYVDSHSHVLAMLRRVAELDAEDAVVSIATDTEGSVLHIACMTAVGRVLAWRVDVAEGHSGPEPPAPVFDLDMASCPLDLPGGRMEHYAAQNDKESSLRALCVERLCWLRGSRRARMLAVLYESNDASAQSCVRLWDLNDARMPLAKIAPPNSRAATCVSRGDGSATVLVGGDGYIAEYDRTGLLLHEFAVGAAAGPFSGLCVAGDERRLFARAGTREILSWSPSGGP